MDLRRLTKFATIGIKLCLLNKKSANICLKLGKICHYRVLYIDIVRNTGVLILDKDTQSKLKCIEENCPKGPLVTDNNTGEILCSGCGLVVIDKVEVAGPEQNVFSSEEYFEKARTGAKSSLAIDDMGLATVIDAKDKDAMGNSLSVEMRNTFGRLRIWDSRSKSRSTEKSMRTAFVLLNNVKSKLAIPDMVVEKTAYMYRKMLAKKMTRGRSIAAMVLASLYVACREANTPRTLQDIASSGNISQKDLSRHVRILISTLDLKLESYDSSGFVNRIASTMGISEKTQRDALNILSKAKEKGYTTGKNPMAMAASSLYLSCLANSEKQTQKELSAASGISMVTIRNRTSSLAKVLNFYGLLTKNIAA